MIASILKSSRQRTKWLVFAVGLLAGIIGLLYAIESFQTSLHDLASPLSGWIFTASVVIDLAVFAFLSVRKQDLLAAVIMALVVIDLVLLGYPVASCMSC